MPFWWTCLYIYGTFVNRISLVLGLRDLHVSFRNKGLALCLQAVYLHASSCLQMLGGLSKSSEVTQISSKTALWPAVQFCCKQSNLTYLCHNPSPSNFTSVSNQCRDSSNGYDICLMVTTNPFDFSSQISPSKAGPIFPKLPDSAQFEKTQYPLTSIGKSIDLPGAQPTNLAKPSVAYYCLVVRISLAWWAHTFWAL